MQTFHAETVVEKNGKLHLDHLPFPEGEPVHVFVTAAKPIQKRPLQGTVLKYEQPFASAADGDWNAAK